MNVGKAGPHRGNYFRIRATKGGTEYLVPFTVDPENSLSLRVKRESFDRLVDIGNDIFYITAIEIRTADPVVPLSAVMFLAPVNTG